LTKKVKKTNSKKSQFHTGILVLENRKIFKGIGIGYQGEATGEVCFNTSLTGYQEIISDPSYAGQIINFTFPHIGNVGTNKEDVESDKIWARGVIFNSEITSPSNYRAFLHLDAWLKKNKIVGITGLDTRSLTNFIRDKGAPKGTISYSKNGKFNVSTLTNSTIKWSGLKNLDLAETVTTSKNYVWKGFKTWRKETGYKKNKKNSFHRVLWDHAMDPKTKGFVKLKKNNEIKKVILCSGKIYFDLLSAREKLKKDDVILFRIEQLYPFPAKSLVKEIKPFAKNAKFYWCQEEPKNMGAWSHVRDYIQWTLDFIKANNKNISYIGRVPAASPATGYAKRHVAQQKEILEKVFN